MSDKYTVSPANLDWFVHDRFGLFIHWGLYSLPARHEWVRNREKISNEDYQKYFDHFDPDLYDPRVWAEEAKNAGMKYVVITTKHHEGFCLWDSALTDYKAPNTPARRDLLRPLVDAFRGEGFKIGFYHSLIDWHHPDFPIDGLHPMRDDLAFREQEKDRDIRKYAEYLHGQTRELLTQFGKIDILWFDFSYSRQDWGWSQGQGQGRLAVREAAQDGARAAAGHHRQRPAGDRRRRQDARAVPAARLDGSRTASPWCGKPARRSTAAGATTATTWTGSRWTCWCGC